MNVLVTLIAGQLLSFVNRLITSHEQILMMKPCDLNKFYTLWWFKNVKFLLGYSVT